MESVVSAPIPSFISSSISLKILYLSRFFGTPVFRIHLLYTFLHGSGGGAFFFASFSIEIEEYLQLFHFVVMIIGISVLL